MNTTPYSPKNLVDFLAHMLACMLLFSCGGSTQNDATKTVVDTPPDEQTTPSLFFEAKTQEAGLFHQWQLIDLQSQTQVNLEEHPIVKSSFHSSGGIAVGDYDQDGDLDLFIVGGNKQASKLYQKQDDGGYLNVADHAGLSFLGLYSGPSFVDTDNDGDLDLFIGGMGNTKSRLMINEGNGTFKDGPALAITKEFTHSAAFADINSDGLLDMALSHYASELSDDSEHLWLNLGDNVFESVSAASGIMDSKLNGYSDPLGRDLTFTPNFADINNDGEVDLLMASDYRTSVAMLNTGSGSFVDNSQALNLNIDDLHGMGATVADIDNDGDLDWFVTNIVQFQQQNGSLKYSGNKLLQNQGDGSFVDISYQSNIYNGGWGWASCIADFNNDGLLDLFNTNGWILSSDSSGKFESHDNDTVKLFLATESGVFEELNTEIGLTHQGQGRAALCFDHDADGDIDILLANHDLNTNALVLYENTSVQGNYLSVDLRTEHNNRFAIGARVYLKTEGRQQMREVNSNSNYTSQTPTQLHFGLGNSDTVEEVTIQWPNGEHQTINNISANQALVVHQ